DWRQTYLRGGSFDRRAMTALVDDLQRGARAQGFARARLMGHGEWALQADCDGAALVEYEAWVNDGLGQYDDPVVCIYDRNRFAGATAIDVLRAHPTVILDGALRENPSFLAPTRLLSKLHGGAVSVLRDRYVAALVAGAHREA